MRDDVTARLRAATGEMFTVRGDGELHLVIENVPRMTTLCGLSLTADYEGVDVRGLAWLDHPERCEACLLQFQKLIEVTI